MKIVGSIIGLLVFQILNIPVVIVNTIFRAIKTLYMLARYAICWKIFRKWPKPSNYDSIGFKDVVLRNNSSVFRKLCKRNRELYVYWVAVKRKHLEFYETRIIPLIYRVSRRLTMTTICFVHDAEIVGFVEKTATAIIAPFGRLAFKTWYFIEDKIIQPLSEKKLEYRLRHPRKNKSKNSDADALVGDTVGDSLRTIGIFDDLMALFFWNEPQLKWLEGNQDFMKFWKRKNNGLVNGLSALIERDDSRAPA